VHIVPPKLPLNLPAVQDVHANWPTVLIFPTTHSVQAEPSSTFSAVPSKLEYLPAEQLLQSLYPTPLYLPVAQRVQVELPELDACLPPTQSVHAESPLALTLPAEQGEHVLLPEELV
jgi:hypothetical protein